jgi:dipeptidyl aminopeptidase/acylaminoacyl peptidase
MKSSHLLFFPLFSFFASLVHAGAETPRIPVEDFFREAEFSEFRISRDGKTLAAVGNWEGRRNLYTYDIDSGEARRLTGYTKHDVTDVVWASNDRILYRLLDANRYWGTNGLFAIGKDGSLPRTLAKPISANPMATPRSTTIIDLLPDDPDYVLVARNNRDRDYPDVFRMHLVTEGGVRTVFNNPGNVVDYLADHNGVVRMGMTMDRDGSRTGIIYRKSEDAEWETLDSFDAFGRGWRPLAFDYDQERVFVATSTQSGFEEIHVYDPRTRTLGPRVYGMEGFDVSGLIMSDHLRAVIGVTYQADKPGVVWFHDEKQLIQEYLDRRFPETVNAISSMSADETRMVVTSFSDRHPPIYHLLKIENGGIQLDPIGRSRAWLNPEHMGEMKPIVYEARDGLTIHGYLTLPKSYSEGNPVPLIVNPHGGPWARDYWGFNPEVQFLANRGFAVLQMNFRGSTGFGVDFLRAGDQAWGAAMQDDVIDGVRWAVEQGYADPERIGIFGASYGGYTTMMQLIQHPDVYKFGINYVGVVDLRDIIRNASGHRASAAYLARAVGDLSDDSEMLRAASPIHRAGEVKAALMVIHGAEDAQVPIDHARRLNRALSSANVPFEYIIKRDEGHGFRKPENVRELYEAIDAFIAPYAK